MSSRKLWVLCWNALCYKSIYWKHVSWAVLPIAIIKVLQGLRRMRVRKSEQFRQWLRISLVTGIVLYCKVLVSCRDPTYVTICKYILNWMLWKPYLLTRSLTHLLIFIDTFDQCSLGFSVYCHLSTNRKRKASSKHKESQHKSVINNTYERRG